MPGFDRTGPQGQGPMTGGRRGYCATGTPATEPFPGYGVGRGGRPFGGGRGRCFGGGRGGWRGWSTPPTQQQEATPSEPLFEKMDALQRENDELRARLEKLETKEQ